MKIYKYKKHMNNTSTIKNNTKKQQTTSMKLIVSLHINSVCEQKNTTLYIGFMLIIFTHFIHLIK